VVGFIAITPKSVIDKNGAYFDTRRKSMTPDFGVWVEGNERTSFETFPFFAFFRILLYHSNPLIKMVLISILVENP
jgi:hypothetical protein